MTSCTNYEKMNRKIKPQKAEFIVPEMRLNECELFELAHVVRVRPVLKEREKGICPKCHTYSVLLCMSLL